MERLSGNLSKFIPNLPEDIQIRLESGIPNLSDEDLLKRYKKIKPFIKLMFGKERGYALENFSLYDLRYSNYIHEALVKRTREIVCNYSPFDMDGLQELRDFICLHNFYNPHIFSPTISEVLSQFPTDLLDSADFFQIIETPRETYDLIQYNHVTSKGYHLSKVMTYKLK